MASIFETALGNYFRLVVIGGLISACAAAEKSQKKRHDNFGKTFIKGHSLKEVNTLVVVLGYDNLSQ